MPDKTISTAKLVSLLHQLPKDYLLYSNVVGNLTILDEGLGYKGFIDFTFDKLELIKEKAIMIDIIKTTPYQKFEVQVREKDKTEWSDFEIYPTKGAAEVVCSNIEAGYEKVETRIVTLQAIGDHNNNE